MERQLLKLWALWKKKQKQINSQIEHKLHLLPSKLPFLLVREIFNFHSKLQSFHWNILVYSKKFTEKKVHNDGKKKGPLKLFTALLIWNLFYYGAQMLWRILRSPHFGMQWYFLAFERDGWEQSLDEWHKSPNSRNKKTETVGDKNKPKEFPRFHDRFRKMKWLTE